MAVPYPEHIITRAVALCVEGNQSYEQAARIMGVAASTIRQWVAARHPGVHAARTRPRVGQGPNCDICDIVLGEDDLCAPDGRVIHPPTTKDKTRCWLCERLYGAGPAKDILPRWGLDAPGKRRSAK